MSINTPDVHFARKSDSQCAAVGKFTNAKMLRFDDVEDEYGGVECVRSRLTDIVDTSPSNAPMWDSGLGSPTPGSSPKTTLRGPSSARRGCTGYMSPIPFSTLDDSDDDESPLPRSGQPPAAPDTPPHRRLRRLRLNDTPHTPKSLLEKSQRRVAVSDHHYANADVSESRYARNVRMTPQIVLDPSRPQTNVNPFTTCRKRTRHEVDECVELYHSSVTGRLNNPSRYLP